MQRICGTLQDNGYDVLLIGRENKKSPQLSPQIFKQKRLHCFFNKGFLFYGEYNIRLFFYLMSIRTDVYCAIDLDTILPVYFVSIFKNTKRVYDAHEYFTEQKEIVTRPLVHRVWLTIEKFAVPRFPKGYTVNQSLSHFFYQKYKVEYKVVRNLPKFYALEKVEKEDYIIYQGALNEGRGFETLIPAMQYVNKPLRIYGKGNFETKAKYIVKNLGLENKVFFMGNIAPEALNEATIKAFAGIMIVENTGLSLYYSLANKFFDYMMAEIPQICIGYPEYRTINDQYNFAYLIDNIEINTLTNSLNKLSNNIELYKELKENCSNSKKELNWEKESTILIDFYKNMDSK
ncbi:glycosyltransferase family 4 protein [Rhizosphaericola mali]|uniref:Glycosyltransferase family 4 protein n=2 Tax=Rhizosphaericola mali TaxID=2545455 RepID=A0A5P2G5A6_9BACT|nr:glycosyltransferase family 4 protein [Rhizosphaericola mali]